MIGIGGFGWVLVVVVVLIVAVVLYGVLAYNGMVRARNLIQESWRQVDVELNRRYDLLPNVIETVRGYAGHERATLDQLTELRGRAATLAQQSGGLSEQRAQVEQQLTGAVRSLIVSAEAYPDLKSNQNYLALQQQLAETEDRIAAGRRYYNANVGDYNTRIESFPGNLVAGMASFTRATYFEANDQAVRQTPRVDFGGRPDEIAPAEPTNAQLAQADEPQALPDPQGRQQAAPGAPAPGELSGGPGSPFEPPRG